MRTTPLLPCLSLLSLALLPIGCTAPSTAPYSDPGASSGQAPVMLVLDGGVDVEPKGDLFNDARPRAAANALLASLDDAQRQKISFALDSQTRTDWHYIPRNRVGLPMGEMTDAQKRRLHDLLQTALSSAGYLKACDILWLETLLAELENNPRGRDVGKYVVQLFGDPADADAAWGWRLEGHHLSLNLLYADGQVRVTPMFFGTNPAVVPTGPLAGKRVLSEEHTLALELVETMTDEQRDKMMLEGKPRDIITGPGREGLKGDFAGIHIEDLTEPQTRQLLSVVGCFASNVNFDIAMHRAKQYAAANRMDQWYEIHFAWAGPTDGSGPFYYRIHTPLYVIEYSCQNANHVHAVFHDLTDPLGKDLLREHFERHEHD
ncbi:MAG: DUF3500 domain-containing protein [Planctomycetota bacterium]